MPELTLHIYPQGHGHTMPPDKRYLSGRRLIREFLKAGWIQPGEYSLLLYDTDRVKIEIARDQQLDAESIKNLLKSEEHQLTIACWREDKSASDIKKKCQATRIREEMLGDRAPSELGDEEWAAGIRRHGPQADLLDLNPGRYDLHLVLNPLGDSREEVIRQSLLRPGKLKVIYL